MKALYRELSLHEPHPEACSVPRMRESYAAPSRKRLHPVDAIANVMSLRNNILYMLLLLLLDEEEEDEEFEELLLLFLILWLRNT